MAKMRVSSWAGKNVDLFLASVGIHYAKFEEMKFTIDINEKFEYICGVITH